MKESKPKELNEDEGTIKMEIVDLTGKEDGLKKQN